MPENQEYVTNGKLNNVIFELKTELRDVDNKHEKLYTELRHSNQMLNTTLSNLNNSIDKNLEVMNNINKSLEKTQDEVTIMKHENISRDYILKDLEEFKEETAGKLSSRFTEIIKLVGIISGVFGTIIVAIINLAPLLFG